MIFEMQSVAVSKQPEKQIKSLAFLIMSICENTTPEKLDDFIRSFMVARFSAYEPRAYLTS